MNEVADVFCILILEVDRMDSVMEEGGQFRRVLVVGVTTSRVYRP